MNRIKKLISILLVLCLLPVMGLSALADRVDNAGVGEERVTLGADLTEDQILTVYGDFGLMRGQVTELTVTNADEREYLEGLVADSIIGTRALSCIYIKILEDGAGTTVTTKNISWCTEEMYKSALMTAGIFDAQVMVTAPFSVSGTAALTGIYKAYEDITGTAIEEDAKDAAAEELVVTAELADEIGNEEDAVGIVNDMKLMLDDTSDMDDEELDDQITEVVDTYGYDVSDETIDQIAEMIRDMEPLDLSGLEEEIEAFRDTLDTTVESVREARTWLQRVGDFFRSISQWLSKLFSGSNNETTEPAETTASDEPAENADTDTEAEATQSDAAVRSGDTQDTETQTDDAQAADTEAVPETDGTETAPEDEAAAEDGTETETEAEADTGVVVGPDGENIAEFDGAGK